MIDAISFLIYLLLFTGLSHFLCPYHFINRFVWLIASGIVLLYVVHPFALVFACGSFCVSYCVYLLGRWTNNSRLKSRLPYLILTILIFPEVFKALVDNPVLLLGSAFFVIRQMMTVEQCIKYSVSNTQFIPSLLLATFFCAAIPSGPVFDGLNIYKQLKKNRVADYSEGFYRLFEGFIYLFAMAGICGELSRVATVIGSRDTELLVSVSMEFIAKPLASFGFLFATFYGYSRMAEGNAMLFGLKLPVNFDKPHLAKDLGDFWKRWHRSMANFVMQYIYLPLLVTTSSAKIALISAFMFMAMWHNFSLGFFFWGLGHGLGLAYLLPWARNRGISPMIIRIFSLLIVVSLSSVAHGVWIDE